MGRIKENIVFVVANQISPSINSKTDQILYYMIHRHWIISNNLNEALIIIKQTKQW